MVDTYKFIRSGTASTISPQKKPYIITQHDYDLSLPSIDYGFRAPISLPATSVGTSFGVCAPVADVDANQEPEEDFRRLADTWKKQTGHLSNISKKCTHPAYQQIIGMGSTVIPFILRDLKKTRDDWFWALTAITRENPIPARDAGYINRMTEAWLAWGRARGYDV